MKKVFILCLFFASLLFSNSIEKKKILVLHSYHNGVPWVKEINQGLENSKKKYKNFEFFIENFDAMRLSNKIDDKKVLDFIKYKYQNINFDGVIIESFYAKNALKNYTEEFLPNIPKVYNVKIDKLKNDKSLSLFIDRKTSIKKTINLAFKFNKNSKNIVLIKGNWGDGIEFEKELKATLKNSNKKLRVIENFSKEELLEEVKNIPKNSIVFFTIVTRDKNNKKIIPKFLLKELTALSNARFYSIYTSLLETGIIAGYMTSGVKNAEKMVEALNDYITNKKFKDYYYDMNYYGDWNMIEKFNIDESFIPKDAIVLNKPKTLLESFFYETVLTVIFIIFLMLFLILLIKLNFRLKIETKDRIEKQDLLNQQSKNALMGEMINNIAHQWRQPLARINSNIAVIDLMTNKNDKKDLIDEKLVNIEDQTSYMSSTIDDFSNFFSPEKKKKTFNISHCLKKSIALLSSRLKDININYICDENISICSYENEFSQVILAIVNNAVDNFVLKNINNPTIDILLKKEKSNIIIEISDNGKGIKEEILPYIFEAHFSTKKEIKSSGLGLYISKNIIENSIKGNIEAFNTKVGVCFKIELDKELVK